MATILHQRVMALCKKNRISAKELERQLKYPKNTITSWRISFPLCDRVIEVGEYFDVSTDYLLGKCNNPFSHKTEYCDSTLQLIQASEELHLDAKTTIVAIKALKLLKELSN